jgi:uncharacterized repeat protein (TIGR04076 family)
MAERRDVIITVKDQKGHCAWGHKRGDSWVCAGTTPAGICLSAFGALLPDLRTLQFGGGFPWDRDGVHEMACPDAANPVVFEMRAVRKPE